MRGKIKRRKLQINISLQYALFFPVSVSWVMLTEGAKVTGAHMCSFLQQQQKTTYGICTKVFSTLYGCRVKVEKGIKYEV